MFICFYWYYCLDDFSLPNYYRRPSKQLRSYEEGTIQCIFAFYLYRIAITIMIFVNYGGGGYYFFEHARWNGKKYLQ